MNIIQLIIMWISIGLVLFIGVITLLEPYRPDYELFLFWTLLVVLVAGGLMNTLKINKIKTMRSSKMNLRKGFKRLVFVVSLIPVLIGIIMIIGGIVDEYDDIIVGGFLVAPIGFAVVWAVYGVILFIARGFNANYCANCESDIGKLEEKYTFKEHIVCAECHKKLNQGQENVA